MHRDMVCLIAFDFILRLIRVGVMCVSFVVDVLCMDLNNPAADTSGLGIPGDVVADFETFLQCPPLDASPHTTTLSRFAARVIPV